MVRPVDAEKTLILGIETSCDETAVSVVANGQEILSNVVASQVELHRPFGGVIPEIASRAHLRNLPFLLEEALDQSGYPLEEMDAIGVTQGPGLVGALLVGLSYAKGLALALGKPLICIDHLEAHVYSAAMEHQELEYPYLALVISGGHTGLYLAHSPLQCELLGETLDDAVGEAFDKVAALLGLPYPGGPSVEKAAREGNPHAHAFPRSFLDQKEKIAFSFSGLKTAVLYTSRGKNRSKGAELLPEVSVPDLAASFQQAAIEAVVEKTLQAAQLYNISTIAVGGGVARNGSLRQYFERRAREENCTVYFPSPQFCTDNAAMIAGLAYHHYCAQQFSSLDCEATP